MAPPTKVHIGPLAVGGDSPHILIAGPCVIESETIVLETAAGIAKIAQELHIPFIFKVSYDKANRTSISMLLKLQKSSISCRSQPFFAGKQTCCVRQPNLGAWSM
jgi:hypothetical protein